MGFLVLYERYIAADANTPFDADALRRCDACEEESCVLRPGYEQTRSVVPLSPWERACECGVSFRSCVAHQRVCLGRDGAEERGATVEANRYLGGGFGTDVRTAHHTLSLA